MQIARSIIAGALAALMSTTAASAQDVAEARPNYFPETSEQLLDLLKTCQDDSCMSYVSGVIGGILVYATIAEKPSPFCARGSLSRDDVREAVISTIESTEALEGQHPAVAILTAFGRYWPCMTRDQIDDLQATSLQPVDSADVDALMGSQGHALVLGPSDAPANKTIVVFHDPNCSHCRRFRNETDKLAEMGWKVMIFPVATSSEESAGYGAVELALREESPEATSALYRHDPSSLADITLAMSLAEKMGVQTKDIMLSLAKSGAYARVEANTRTFFQMGAKGTPAWIVGTSLYSGFLGADAIVDLASEFEGDEGPSMPSGEPQE